MIVIFSHSSARITTLTGAGATYYGDNVLTSLKEAAVPGTSQQALLKEILGEKK